MKETTHNFSQPVVNRYHMEDSVWTHTMMVCKLAQHLCPEDQNIQIACLLHDIGKVFTRVENYEKQRVSFFNHAQYSFFHSIDILNKMPFYFPIDDEDKQEILSLIALHDRLMRIGSNATRIATTFKDNKLLLEKLAKLYYCDVNGRLFDTTVDCKDRYVDREDVYRITQSRIHTNSIDSFKNEITFLVGLPCSGKSTYVKKLLRKDYRLSIVSRDDVLLDLAETDNYDVAWNKVDQKEVDKLLNEELRDCLADDDSIVIDMTNLSRKGRNKFLSQVPKTYKKKCVLFCTGLDVIRDRNNNRENKFISSEVYNRMISSFSLPLYDQFDEIEWKF